MRLATWFLLRLQQGLAGFCYLEIEIAVTNQTEQDTVAVDAIVPHHLLYGNLAGSRTLVGDVLNKIWIRCHSFK